MHSEDWSLTATGNAPRPAAARARLAASALAATALVLAAGAHAQQSATGTVEHITVHAPSLEGNLQGNSLDRDVLVYLPPSYASSPNRRYPVVYNLHGWLPGAEEWAGMIDFEAGSNAAIAEGRAKEMIVVVPDSLSVLGGSMYSSSVTAGDFESFIAHDLVAEIDRRYRTIADRESRGLSGHSMGGYGTMRIGMKHPEVYSSIYVMSACCLTPYEMPQPANVETLEDALEVPIFGRVNLTLAAAWSPNPSKPPLYFDFPAEGGEQHPQILQKWNANVPLVVIDQYIGALRQFEAIAIDMGTQDGLIVGSNQLSEILTAYDIEHTYETYQGNHTNRVAERYTDHVLPFFSEVLDFE